MANLSSLLGGAAPPGLWAPGTAYMAGQYAVSPVSWHVYLRKSGGTPAATTDPSADRTRWQLVGAGGIRSIQRGRLLVAIDPTAVTIAAVNPAKCVVHVSEAGYGPNGAGPLQNGLRDFALAATTLTITRGNAGSNSAYFWQVIEYWG